MKQLQYFCIKSFLFTASMILLSYICNYVFIDKLKAYFPLFAGREIYYAIHKSKNKVKVKKLIIGDSTANQFFDNSKTDANFYSLTCNQAINVCGQFFLLNNFLKAGNSPEEVYMLFSPGSFANNLNQILTYHYFVKPFYRDEYKCLMSKNVKDQISKIPFYEFAQFPLTISSAWAPDYQPDDKIDSFLSPISIEYLVKIDSLREKYGFNLYIVPTLTAKSKESQIADYNYDEIKNANIAKLLSIYLENVRYLPDDRYMDGIHLSKPLDYKDIMLDEMEVIKRKVNYAPKK